MITKISHIGIAVKDLQKAKETYRKLLQSEPSPDEVVEEQKVRVSKFKLGESTIELIEATSPDSTIAKFIESKGEGIHHIAYESDNIEKELERISAEDFELINNHPVIGSDNMRVAFVNPKSTGKVLTEICQH